MTSTLRLGPFRLELDDSNLGVAGLEEGAEPLKDDHVIVYECDPNRFGHAILYVHTRTPKSPDRVIDPYTTLNDPEEAEHSARKWPLQRDSERVSFMGLLQNRDDAACRRPQRVIRRGLMPWA